MKNCEKMNGRPGPELTHAVSETKLKAKQLTNNSKHPAKDRRFKNPTNINRAATKGVLSI